MMTAKAILALKCGVLAFGCGTEQTPAEESVSSADTVPNPCEALTPAAIQASIDRLNQARAEAQLEYDAFYPGGSASSATQRGLEYITQARDAMVYLQTYLHDNGFDTPYVSNTSAAGSVFRDAAWLAAEKRLSTRFSGWIQASGGQAEDEFRRSTA